MKKNVFIILAVLACVVFSTSVFAATLTDAASTTIGGGSYQVSKGVTLTYVSSASAYDAVSHHSQGTKSYGTNHLSPKIFQIDGITQTASASMAFTSWE